MASAQSYEIISRLYITYLNRPADPEGLRYWADQLEGPLGGNIVPIARSMWASDESQAIMGGIGTEVGQVVDRIYNAFLARNPDAEGRAYWISRVTDGGLDIAELPFYLLAGARGSTNDSDRAISQNREAAAKIFTEIADGRSFADPNFGKAPFQATFTSSDTNEARGFLSNVMTTMPTTDAIRQVVIDKIANPGDPIKGGTGGLPILLGTSFEHGDLAKLDIDALNDPLIAAQWYLKNTGQRYADGDVKPNKFLDLNIAGAWADGYTGKGVRVVINDDGLDLKHESMVKNVLADLTYNSVNGATGPDALSTPTTAAQGGAYTPDPEAHGHGTVVGSIVGMAANDGIGMVGIAPDVKLVSGLALSKGNNTSVPKLYNHLTDIVKADVWVNSFGKDPAFSENFFVGPNTDQQSEDYLYLRSIEKGAKEGRNGLGTVIEVSAGNEGPNNADAAMTGTTNNKYIISVGAVNELGQKSSYTTPGASVLVSAFGGENPTDKAQSVNSGFGLVSADITGAAGYNTQAGAAGNYAFQNFGTSYSGPIVGATAALMLQANPLLGFRDVANILAMTARVIEPNNHTVLTGNLVNFGGLAFSRDIGFGLVDISAAVRLAASWVDAAKTAANWVSAEGTSASAAADIPDNDPNGTTATATLNKNVIIERMEFDLKLNSNTPSQLRAEITSPNGTTIVLFDQPLSKDTDAAAGTADTPWPETFQIGATAFFGEQSAGEWKLKLIDKVTGEVSRFETLTVRAWGSEVTQDNQYVLTDAYTGERTVTDAAGVDLINAAAVSGSVSINLNAGETSTIAAGKFVIGTGVVIENAFGGAGNDFIIGNDQGNVLRGNGGADTLTGNGGADIFMFTTVNDSRSGARDTITDFAVGVDKIDLRLLDANITLAGNQDFGFGGQNAATLAHSVTFSFVDANTVIFADVNGDTVADVEIMLIGQKQLTAGDFLGLAA